MLLGLSGPPRERERERERERDCPVESLRETERAGMKNLDFFAQSVMTVMIIRTRQRGRDGADKQKERDRGWGQT